MIDTALLTNEQQQKICFNLQRDDNINDMKDEKVDDDDEDTDENDLATIKAWLTLNPENIITVLANSAKDDLKSTFEKTVCDRIKCELLKLDVLDVFTAKQEKLVSVWDELSLIEKENMLFYQVLQDVNELFAKYFTNIVNRSRYKMAHSKRYQINDQCGITQCEKELLKCNKFFDIYGSKETNRKYYLNLLRWFHNTQVYEMPNGIPCVRGALSDLWCMEFLSKYPASFGNLYSDSLILELFIAGTTAANMKMGDYIYSFLPSDFFSSPAIGHSPRDFRALAIALAKNDTITVDHYKKKLDLAFNGYGPVLQSMSHVLILVPCQV